MHESALDVNRDVDSREDAEPRRGGSKRIHHKRHRGHERTAEEKVTKNSGQVIKQEARV